LGAVKEPRWSRSVGAYLVTAGFVGIFWLAGVNGIRKVFWVLFWLSFGHCGCLGGVCVVVGAAALLVGRACHYSEVIRLSIKKCQAPPKFLRLTGRAPPSPPSA